MGILVLNPNEVVPMIKSMTALCQDSPLAFAQATILKEKLANLQPGFVLNIQRVSCDDIADDIHRRDLIIDLFQSMLIEGKGDFAVHAAKDITNQKYSSAAIFTFIDKDNPRDIAVFHARITDRIADGAPLRIGCSAARRKLMAKDFLEKALPKSSGKKPRLEMLDFKGRPDEKLRDFESAGFDGIILSAAALNRLLKFEDTRTETQNALADKKIMLLPLVECPPAVNQGVIAVQTVDTNVDANALMAFLQDDLISAAVNQERKLATAWQMSCDIPSGCFYFDSPHQAFSYIAGRRNTLPFHHWSFAAPTISDDHIFSSADFMQDFFKHRFFEDVSIDESAAVFIASHKAIHSVQILNAIRNRRIWAAGTKTWLALAERGCWVEGSADGFGLNSLISTFSSPLVQLEKHDVIIITNNGSETHWRNDGWKTAGTYELVPALSESVKAAVENSDFVFWTSFQQYLLCRDLLKPSVTHACAVGKTATLLKNELLEPVIFPGIKAFNDWRKSSGTRQRQST